MSIIGKVLNSRNDEKNPISIKAVKGNYLKCKNEEKNIMLSTASFQTTGYQRTGSKMRQAVIYMGDQISFLRY